MKKVSYFSHDSNTRNDPDIYAMRVVYEKGYGWYFMILEIMREQPDYKLEIKPYTYEVLSRQLHCTETEIKEFINDCVNSFKLFKLEKNVLYSNEFLKRMKYMEDISEIRSKARTKLKQNNNKTKTKLNQKHPINKEINKYINKKDFLKNVNTKDDFEPFEEKHINKKRIIK